MLIQGQVGIPTIRQTIGNPNIAQGFFGELLVSELTPVCYSLVKANRTFFANTGSAGISPTAYTGAAIVSNTVGPMIGIYNPAGSGYDVVVIHTRIGCRSTGSGAVNIDFAWWGSQQAIPVLNSGATTSPTNAYSLQTSGSIALGFINSAFLTLAATNLIGPVASIGTTTSTPVTNVFQALDLTQGAIIASPGTFIGLACSATPTSAVIDASVHWVELPA